MSAGTTYSLGAQNILDTDTPCDTVKPVVRRAFTYTASAPSAAPVTVMPTGNSITFDNDITAGDPRPVGARTAYRYELWRLLDSAGFAVCFTGTRYAGYDSFPQAHTTAYPGSPDHAFPQLIRSGLFNFYWSQPTSPGPLLHAYPSEIVLLEIGTNQLDTVSTDVREILDAIDEHERAQGAPVVAVVSRIINQNPASATVTTFNNNVERMVRERIGAGDRVMMVNLESGAGLNYVVGDDMLDGVHPNGNGYRKMARVFFRDALVPLFSMKPVVRISSPSDSITVGPLDTVTIRAGAFCLRDSIRRVEFFVDSAFTGADSSTPYFLSLSHVGSGVHTVRALGISTAGDSGWSNTVRIIRPLRIMPIGNSITETTNSDTSYRCYLWKTLRDSSIRADYVGSRTGVWKWLAPDGGHGGSEPCTRCPYAGFDQDHEGHLAWEANHVLFGSESAAYNSHPGTLGAWARTHLPDIALVHLGTNDMDRGHGVESTIQELGLVIDTLRACVPGITVLLAQVLPAKPDSNNTRNAELNARIPALAASKTQPWSPVVVVDQYTGIDRATDLKDWLHPSRTGAQKMAARWFAKIDSLRRVSLPPPSVWRLPSRWTDTVRVATRGAPAEAVVRYTTDGSTPSRFSPICTAPLTLGGSATRIVQFRTFAAGNADSSSVTRTAVTTSRSTDAPRIAGATAIGTDLVAVWFSKQLDPASSQQTANYSISGGVTVLSASLQSDSTRVVLGVSPMSSGSSYTLSVTAVRDASPSANAIAAGATASLRCSPGIGLGRVLYKDTSLTTDTASSPAPLDTTIDFDWGTANHPRPSGSFAIRWTGTILAPYTDQYRFAAVSTHGARVWVDGTLLVHRWKQQYRVETTGSIRLAAGQRYSIRVEYLYNSPSGSNANMQLCWSSLGGLVPSGVIPRRYLDSLSNSAPLFRSGAPLTATEGVLYEYVPDAADSQSNAIRWSAAFANRPYGLEFDSLNGAIRWTPGEGQTTSGQITLTAKDNGIPSMQSSQVFTITVTPRNQSPFIKTAPVTAALRNSAYSYTPRWADPEGDVVTWSLATAPAGMSVNPSSGAIAWVPGPSALNATSVVLRGKDNATPSCSTEQSWTIRVNAPPTLTGTVSGLKTEEGRFMALSLALLQVSDPDNTYPTDFSLRIHAGAGYAAGSGGITAGEFSRGTLRVPVRVFDGIDSSNVCTLSVAVAPTWRIMPLGNSITEAGDNEISYRCWLWRTLADSGARFNFVGTRWGVFAGYSHAYPAPALQEASKCPYADFDQDNEGHTAWRVDELLYGSVDNTYGYPGRCGAWARTCQPDIVLLHGGTNDVVFQGQSVASTRNELSWTIDTLRSVNPRVVILLAQIIPTTNANNFKVAQLNDSIRVLATAKTTSASPVLLVDQYTGFNAVTDCLDGVHPGTIGEQKMADRWFARLKLFIKGKPHIESQRSMNTPEDTPVRLSLLDLNVVDLNDTFPTGFSLIVGDGPHHSAADTTVTPELNYSGTLTVPVRVFDGTDTSDAFQFQITVTPANDPPAITSTAPTDATEHAPWTYTPSASDPEGNPVLWHLTSGPAGMSINQSSGAMAWTPPEGVATSVPVTIRAVDNGTPACSSSQSFTIAVTLVNDQPVITSTAPTTATEHIAWTHLPAATDPEGNQVLWHLTSGPVGMTINQSTGAMAWTPPEGVASSVPVTIHVVDNGSPACSSAQSLSIAVTRVNDTPVWTREPDRSLHERDTLLIRLTATDPEGAAVVYRSDAAMALASPAVLDSLTGWFEWSPSYADSGIWTVVFEAHDGVTRSWDTLAIRVIDVAPGGVTFAGLGDSAQVCNGATAAWSGNRVRTGNGTVGGLLPGIWPFAVLQPGSQQLHFRPHVRSGADTLINAVLQNAVPRVLGPLDTLRSPAGPLLVAASAGLELGDLDADGSDELIALTVGGRFTRYRGPDPAWSTGLPPRDSTGSDLTAPGAMAMRLADWDADGRVDILVATVSDSVRWYANLDPQGLVFSAPRHIYHSAVALSGLDIADLNDDGRADLVLARSDGAVEPVLALAGSGWAAARVMRTPAGDTLDLGPDPSILMTDMTGDGRLDMVSSSFDSSLRWHVADSAGAFTARGALACDGDTVHASGAVRIAPALVGSSYRAGALLADNGGLARIGVWVLRGDINGDSRVDILDLQRLAFSWGLQCTDPGWSRAANLSLATQSDGVQVVNILDLQVLAQSWGCSP